MCVHASFTTEAMKNTAYIATLAIVQLFINLQKDCQSNIELYPSSIPISLISPLKKSYCSNNQTFKDPIANEQLAHLSSVIQYGVYQVCC